ncbi:hypothetical protein CSB45_10675 [candidate division KSB3 bacterium]|uniref:histidine kinase n=1 Tax=candidate division KSB3 bacterium TaxID=2044937 RepID=A0A2G6E3M5_9BACT|nr:MAG: hypothetical protein CSB45_10675 [candidate division KSB3 bacterium]PIE29128.1 MAG: hypothetical protein CSA57_09950 [candidate division KSB3 bacterium]
MPDSEHKQATCETTRKVIVCVDDDRALLEGLTQQLDAAFGEEYDVEGAESALEAIELIERLYEEGHVVDMVISDQVMPGMKGDELLERLHVQYPDTIKIMLTGQAGLDSAIHAINNAGLSRYLVKPWDDDEFILAVRDLLDRLELERENKRLFQELQVAYKQLVETQEQLIETEKLAVVGKMATGIVHEIRNQLTVLGYAEVIKMAVPDNQKVNEYVQNVLDARVRILSVVDEIRRFARKQTQPYQKDSYLLTEVIESALTIIAYDQDAKRRKFITEYQVEPFLVLNRNKIIQVLLNMLRNAIQATTEDGTITIVVTKNAEYVIIDVSDDGCGIPSNQLESIWEPFFTTKGERGTGLGLEICKRIIKGHSGSISCQSEEGKGSTFTIRLPLDSGDTADNTVSSS